MPEGGWDDAVMDAAVKVEGLSKRFGDVHALDGIDFGIAQGTIFGLLGPNGAGKTTAVRILATVLKPDAGHAEVLGHDVVHDAESVRMLIGLAGQYAAVDPNLTGRENLALMGKLAQVEPSAIGPRAAELLQQFDLMDAADRPVRTYSGGMRRRLDVAASLVQKPPVLFLDEPTTGLDLQSRHELWRAIRTLVDEGTTVILTTQYLEEADQLAHRLVVVDRGAIIAEGTARQLKDRLGGTVIEMTMAGEDDIARAISLVEPIAGAKVERDGLLLRLPSPDGSHLLAQVIRRLDEEGVLPATVSLREPSLDDVFLSLTGHVAEDATAAEGAQERAKGGDGR
ncbi:MAG TPA: ATP-binding cassette domain-containing protein [Actinomycetota bacterium]|nr:ATP-binding cassette domain-containing protein [Actinomycetota bacterium]